MESGSRKRPGKRIGDDLCSILKDKAKMKRLPGPGQQIFIFLNANKHKQLFVYSSSTADTFFFTSRSSKIS